MQQDPRRRAAARTIYDTCFPTGELAPVGFDEAELHVTIHYRRAIAAARGAQDNLAECGQQLPLF
jgi:hypothetical protein